jgi:hypothetical protein
MPCGVDLATYILHQIRQLPRLYRDDDDVRSAQRGAVVGAGVEAFAREVVEQVRMPARNGDVRGSVTAGNHQAARDGRTEIAAAQNGKAL